MTAADRVRKRFEITGVVQGVGFRPFVFQLARRFGLTGWVLNHAQGVTAEAEGALAGLESFAKALVAEQPALAKIAAVRQEVIPVAGDKVFEIRESVAGAERKTFISPDTYVCDDCLREMSDPNDRRYCFPFINCTNCGPRYSIITDIPYDRPNTTMARFEMCPECRREYENHMDRRFHAQPTACPQCGPHLEVWDSLGRRVNTKDPIREVCERLKWGDIGAIKGIGGFHLVCDAVNDSSVMELRKRKRREEKPFAVMARDIEEARKCAKISDRESELLLSFRRPIVLLPKLLPERLSAGIAPGSRHYGIMLPYTPIHFLLFNDGFSTLVMTSANLSDEPICIDNKEAMERLKGIADFYLVHDRDIITRSDDSITRVMAGTPRVLRRSRGYVPLPVSFSDDGPSVLAVGGELKGTICLTKGRDAFVSQHIGDLDNELALGFFEETNANLRKLLEIQPQVVAHDMHPDYVSTRYAKQTGLPLVAVQHHHAHIASVLAEQGEAGPVLGVALDGTGYGPDGTIWGGEFLIADLRQFRRVGRLSLMPLPGGDVASKEPWRTAVAYLYTAYGEDWRRLQIPFVKGISADSSGMITQMIAARINTPLTSSTGRLFDAVSSLIGICHRNTYEGQAPMSLEAAARPGIDEALPFEFREADGMIQINVAAMIREVVECILRKEPPDLISAKFHNAMSSAVVDMCMEIKRREQFTHVALSGGVFQNLYLFERVMNALRANGLTALTHELMPPNDGCISLGQAAVCRANAR